MSGAPVQLWMYDLSKGMAKHVSKLLSRREIDGIWHTSIVVFDREIWFGDGITTGVPGTCHVIKGTASQEAINADATQLGLPHQVMTLGNTQIDERTFDDFLLQTRDFFKTERYHLLGFNCNTFANLCAAFLTGQSIPERIQDLPIDFLSTTIGWMLNPAIQAHYRASVSKGSEDSAAPLEKKSRSKMDTVWSTGAWAIGAVVTTSSKLVGSTIGSSSTRP